MTVSSDHNEWTTTDEKQQIATMLKSVNGVTDVRVETVIHITTVAPKELDRHAIYSMEVQIMELFPHLALSFGVEFERSEDQR